MPPWARKHDPPGAPIDAPRIAYPRTLEDLITLCATHSGEERLHAAGSHWALSTAALSDHTFVETNDPANLRVGMARTLHEVVPGCLSSEFLQAMAGRAVPGFEDNLDDQAPFPVHVEAGKRIAQLYAELDQNAEDDPIGLARRLSTEYGTTAYNGPWGFRTLGSAGGQTVFGALTTGTHGGDFRGPPLADDVLALHLVADGGRHYWIEPRVQLGEMPHLTDDEALERVYGAARFGGPDNFSIVRDDDLFQAVLVAAGRFGVVYSLVLRAVRQYMLHEERRLGTWQEVRTLIPDRHGPLYDTPARNRFLQVAVSLTPHDNFTRNLCGITKRWNVRYDDATGPPAGREERVGAVVSAPTPTCPWPVFANAGTSNAFSPDPDDPRKGAAPNFLERACENADFLVGIVSSTVVEIRKFVTEHTVTAGGAVAAVGAVGASVGLLGLLPALAAILPLLEAIVRALEAGGETRFGQAMNDTRNRLLNLSDPNERAAGLFAWQMIVFTAFTSQQADLDYEAISYAVMDRHDYLDQSCTVNVDSIEVFFPADDPMLVAFVDALIAFETRQEFQGRACVGYASLRFTGRGRALLSPSRWDRTCVVEVSGLRDVEGTRELIDYAIALSRDRNFGGILHWGQRNESDAADIEFRFGDPNDPDDGALGRWRRALAGITDDGRLDGFSSAFTRQTGLEVR